VITDIEGVTSKSTGEEPNRKVIIKPTRTESVEGRHSRGGRPRRDGDRSRAPRRDRSDRNDRPQRERTERPEGEENAPVQETVKEQPVRREAKKLDDDFALYGKIEL
jgi:spoIIIJ-associated protein